MQNSDKIDKYLVEYRLRPTPKQEEEKKTTKPTLPTKMSLRDKIEKFSSKSPPKLPPTGGKLGTKPKPSLKTQDIRSTTATTIDQQQQQATEKQQQVHQEKTTTRLSTTINNNKKLKQVGINNNRTQQNPGNNNNNNSEDENTKNEYQQTTATNKTKRINKQR